MDANKPLGRRLAGGLLGVAFVCINATAAEYSGTSAFTFLQIPTGARATSMGQAFTSIPNDIQGIVYNPACLASLAATQASLQHLSYVSDVTEESVSFGRAGREQSLSWGGFLNYLRVGKIDRTMAVMNGAGDGYSDHGQFSTYDMVLGATLAGQIVEGFSAGATVKMLRESLGDATSNGGAADVGVLYQGNDERTWNVGASLLHAGFANKFSDESVTLPLTFRAGASGQPFAQWLFTADYVKRRDHKGEIDFGAEVTPKRMFSLRMGYRYSLKSTDLGSLADWSAGVGFRFKVISLDYAFVPMGDLGMTHRVSLNFRFKSGRT